MPSPSTSRSAKARLAPRPLPGADGESAFEIALRHGFRGTEKEWLASLQTGQRGERGPPGDRGERGERGLAGAAGDPGRDGTPGERGETGERGEPGDNGWTPVFALVADGERRVLQVVRWVGGSGPRPEALLYVGHDGFVSRVDEAVDLRGSRGERGGTAVYTGGGVSLAQVTALIEGVTMEDFDQVPLDDQENTSGSPAVLTFTFPADVHKVWVKLLATSASDTSSGRVRVDGGEPDADTGQPIDAGVPQPITAVTSVVKVYTPAGKTVNVTGYRRRS